jgi:GlpG protein
MRQIATLAEEQARKFADFLRTLCIEAHLERDPAGVAVWIRDEDQVDKARAELEAFSRNPADPRYTKAAAEARELRRQQALEDEAYNEKQRQAQEDADDLFAEDEPSPSQGSRPWTITLLVVCLLVFLGMSGDSVSQVRQVLSFAKIEPLPGNMVALYPVWSGLYQGEVWRLITPIFLHFTIIHLIFNMLMLLSLGGQIESKRGSVKFLLMVLVIALLSNLAEYNVRWTPGQFPPLEFSPSPLFGGMSGVLYGLFGYMWMKSKYEPELELEMPPESVFLMMGWFVLCLLGVIPNVANVAHAVGLLVGLGIGYAPQLWRRSSEN